MTNYYVVLGVAEDADGDTIRSAFRALARRYHPDAGAGSSAAEFRRVLEAYETLNDPERRARYDGRLRGARWPTTPRVESIISKRMAESLFGSPVIFSRVSDTHSIFRDPPSTHPVSVEDLFDDLFAWLAIRRWR